MKLYELAKNYRILFDSMDADDELTDDEIQAYFDTLEMIEGEFDIKAENIACFVKELNDDIEALSKEEKSLKARRQSKEHLRDRLKTMLIDNMKELNKKKIDMPRARVSLRNNPESAICELGDKEFEKWAIEHNMTEVLKCRYELSKTKLKALLEDGKKIPGVHIGRTVSVIIK